MCIRKICLDWKIAPKQSYLLVIFFYKLIELTSNLWSNGLLSVDFLVSIISLLLQNPESQPFMTSCRQVRERKERCNYIIKLSKDTKIFVCLAYLVILLWCLQIEVRLIKIMKLPINQKECENHYSWNNLRFFFTDILSSWWSWTHCNLPECVNNGTLFRVKKSCFPRQVNVKTE